MCVQRVKGEGVERDGRGVVRAAACSCSLRALLSTPGLTPS